MRAPYVLLTRASVLQRWWRWCWLWWYWWWW